MGAVFSKKKGLNILFVGCRTMSRNEIYYARSIARVSRKITGDFCDYIKNSTGFGWEIVNCMEGREIFWGAITLLEQVKRYGNRDLKNIIRWRTEGK